jgi:uncharacterized membrane protein
VFLLAGGFAHFVVTDAYLAQVPDWLPARTFLILASGVVEIGLGAALILLPRHRRVLGWMTAGLFVAILPGNVHQAVAGIDAFGLDTPQARWIRLAFQPVLVVWALWATDAVDRRRERRGDPGRMAKG